MSPVAGSVRLRKHQFGRQASYGTAIAAKRAYPFKGVPDVNLNWTDPEIDAGSLVTVAAPHREKPDLSAALTDPSLRYNNLPLLYCGFFGGGVTPTGAGDSKTWAFDPTVTGTVDDFDPMTYEFGDDVTSDWYQLRDGVLRSCEITMPEGRGALTTSMDWLFGAVFSSGSTDSPDNPAVPTGSLSVSVDDVIVYGKDLGISIASDPDDLDTGLVSGALHTFTLRFSQEIDEKGWADGDQSFDTDAYGRGPIMVELEASWAKTSDIVGTGSESDAWMSDNAVNRFVRIEAISTAIAETGTPDIPYSWLHEMPMRYYTREEGDSNNNTLVVLTGKGFLEPTDFGGFVNAEIVNTLANSGF